MLICHFFVVSAQQPREESCLTVLGHYERLPLQTLSPLAKGTSGAAREFSVHILILCWQRGASVSTMMQLNAPWEFNMLYHGCPTPHAFYNHSHHLFITSWTWGGLKADVTHDDLTSMGEWTRWLIVSKTNTLIISRRAQCNRSLTTNLYLS